VEVSELGGIANLETVDVATGETRPLTRVTGMAAAPEPAGGRVFYLSMHARGMDLMRIRADGAASGPVVALDTTLAPAVRRVAVAEPDTLRRGPLPAPHAYGLGPRRDRLLPTAARDADGAAGGLVLLNADPVGRLSAMLRLVGGRAGMPQGAAANLVYRRWLPSVGMDLFALRQRPSDLRRPLLDRTDSLDADYAGGTLWIEQPWAGSVLRRRLRGGVSAGVLDPRDGNASARTLAFAEALGGFTRSRGAQSLALSAALNGTVGRSGGESWARGVGTVTAGVGALGFNARGQVTYGTVSAGAPRWEQLVAGGARQQLFDDAILSQRVPLPAARFGVARGRELLMYRVSTDIARFTPYLTGVSAGDGFASWYRVAGVETALDTPPLNVLRIPSVRLTAGAGYPLDAPDRHRLAIYGTVAYRP
jgi:hypothetical protein